MLTEYTTFNDVRAALGMSEEEVSDETLGLDTISTLLDEDLLALAPLLVATFAALPAVDAQSALESRLYKLTRLYATYAVAFRLIDTAELFGFIKVADGRASTERVAEAYKNLRTNLAAQLQRIKALLLGALGALVPTVTAPVSAGNVWISSVGLGSDPVTG
jgi:hypothetical protein